MLVTLHYELDEKQRLTWYCRCILPKLVWMDAEFILVFPSALKHQCEKSKGTKNNVGYVVVPKKK